MRGLQGSARDPPHRLASPQPASPTARQAGPHAPGRRRGPAATPRRPHDRARCLSRSLSSSNPSGGRAEATTLIVGEMGSRPIETLNPVRSFKSTVNWYYRLNSSTSYWGINSHGGKRSYLVLLLSPRISWARAPEIVFLSPAQTCSVPLWQFSMLRNKGVFSCPHQLRQ